MSVDAQEPVMTDDELYAAALARAADNGTTEELLILRGHILAGAILGNIEAGLSEYLITLLDAVEASQRPRVGDLIGPNATDIPWDVLEVENSEGDVWRRAFGDEQIYREDDGWTDGQLYDWIATGGWSSTEGMLDYCPLRVTKVAVRPTSDRPRP